MQVLCSSQGDRARVRASVVGGGGVVAAACTYDMHVTTLLFLGVHPCWAVRSQGRTRQTTPTHVVIVNGSCVQYRFVSCGVAFLVRLRRRTPAVSRAARGVDAKKCRPETRRRRGREEKRREATAHSSSIFLVCALTVCSDCWRQSAVYHGI